MLAAAVRAGECFVAKAIEMNRLSLALGTAILLNGRRWTAGLTWSDLAADLVGRKASAKTGAFAAHDLKLCPLVLALLEHVSSERCVGPLILDETAGRPFAESAYGREWRARPACRTTSGT